MVAGGAFAAPLEAPIQGPFVLLQGQEVAVSPPLRDVAAQAFGYTADGGRLLAATPLGPLLLDDRGQVWAEPRCPAGGGTPVRDTVGSQRNELVAALFTNGRACVWEGKGQALHSSPGRNIAAIALGDAETAVFGHATGLVEGRNPLTGSRRWARDPDLGPIVHLRFETNGPRVAASAEGLGVAVFDGRRGRLIRALRNEPAWSAAFSPDGERLAVGRAHGRVEIWNTKRWHSQQTIAFSRGRVVDVDYSPEGGQLAAAIEVGEGASRVVTLEVWDFRTEQFVFREPAPPGPGPTRFRFDAIGFRVLAGNGPGVARLWPQPGARSIPRPIPSEEPPHQRLLPEDFVLPALTTAPATAVAPIREGSSRVPVALSADAGRALVWLARADGVALPGAELAIVDVVTGAMLTLAGTVGVTPILIESDGAHVLTWRASSSEAGSAAGVLSVWDAGTAAVVGRASVPLPRDVSLEGGRLVVTGADGTVAVGGVDGRLRVVPGVSGATCATPDPAHVGRIAVGLEDGEVRVVDSRKGASLGSWGIHAGPISALAFSLDGKRLATSGPRPGGAGTAVTVLSAALGDDEDPWTAVFDAAPNALRFARDGAAVMVVAPTYVAVVDPVLGTVLHLSAPVTDAGFVAGISAEHPQGAVAWMDLDGGVRRVAIGGVTLPLVPRGRPFAKSDDGRFAVTVDGDRVSVWSDLEGRLLRALPATGQAVIGVAFDDSGDRVAVLYADRAIEVYEVESGESLRHLEGPPAANGDWVRFSDDGARLWTLAGPREVVGWDIATGAALERIAIPGDGELRADTTRGKGRFVRLADAGDPASADAIWLDTAADSPRRVTLPADGFRPLAIAPRGRGMAAAQDGGVARLDLQAGRRVGPLLVVAGATPGVAAAFSPDSLFLAVAYEGGLVRVWDLERNAVVVTLAGDAAQYGHAVRPLASVAFDAAGEIVTARDVDGWPRMWEWRVSMEAPAFGTGAGPVAVERDITALAVSPDGRRLYSAHGDANLRGWNLSTGEQTGFFWGHAARVTSAVVVAGGRRLVTGSEDGTVRVWDTDIAIEKVAVSTFGDAVRRVAASADGWRLAAAGDGGVLRSWDGAVGRPLRRWSVAGIDAMELGAKGGSLSVTLGSEGGWSVDPVSGAVRAEERAPLDPPPVALASLRLRAARLAPITAEAETPDGATFITAGADGCIRIWDVQSASLRGILTALTDGSYTIDRLDGTRFASESLRDGSAPLLHRPPPR